MKRQAADQPGHEQPEIHHVSGRNALGNGEFRHRSTIMSDGARSIGLAVPIRLFENGGKGALWDGALWDGALWGQDNKARAAHIPGAEVIIRVGMGHVPIPDKSPMFHKSIVPVSAKVADQT